MFYNEVGSKVDVVRHFHFGPRLIICIYYNLLVFVLCKEQCTWLLILLHSTMEAFGFPITPYGHLQKNTIHSNHNNTQSK